MKYSKILVTGSAGFIGYHLCKKLLNEGYRLIGVDNLNNYYSPILKEKRNELLKQYSNYKFYQVDISNYNELKKIFRENKIDLIIHLAAYAGILYSLKNPWVYEKTNFLGSLNIFELAKEFSIEKVIYASSASVYGGNKKIPTSENDRVDNPLSLYGVTKRSVELLANAYNYLFGIKFIGLRFFNVYGEFGRPDMAFWIFCKNIMLGKPIKLRNFGKMERDFTYVEDIVDGIIKAIHYDAKNEIFNLGNDNPIKLEYAVDLIERHLGKKAMKEYVPMQPAEIVKSWADLTKSRKLLGYNPKIKFEEGIARYCRWFKENWKWIKDIKMIGEK